METVGIIGGSGFIGSHVTQKFLEEGYKVKVSTTDISNREKYGHLSALKNAANMEMQPLDLRDAASIDVFLQDCDIVIHGGTPFMLDIKDPQTELFEPTIKGTENFLALLKKHSRIRKVIFIASVAAWNTSFPMPPASYPANHLFSENDTPYFNENDHPYARAKYLADQAVRKFVSDNSNPAVEIITLSPVMVIGNALSGRPDSTSVGLQYLIKNKIAPNPFLEMLFATNVPFSMVDVRDVALAVFKATIKNGLSGRNYLIANETYKCSDISLMLNQQPPVEPAAFTYDNTLAKKELGMDFIPAKETLFHCA